jgi:hypothetical protein
MSSTIWICDFVSRAMFQCATLTARRLSRLLATPDIFLLAATCGFVVMIAMSIAPALS